MLDSTLKQKFIYNTPFTDDEMPYVILDKLPDNPKMISISQLCSLEYYDFNNLISDLKNRKAFEILLCNDAELHSNNDMIKRAVKCYLMSFAYHFKKQGFRVDILF